MDMHWYNDLFNGDYDNVMNHVVVYVSYSSGYNNNGDGVSNNNDGDDDNYTDNDDDDDNENDVDEEGESFWLREYDHRKLVSIARALVMYYNNYIYLSLHPS